MKILSQQGLYGGYVGGEEKSSSIAQERGIPKAEEDSQTGSGHQQRQRTGKKNKIRGL